MQVSLDSADAEIAGTLVGVPNYLEIARQSITNVQEAGMVATCKAVLTGLNAEGVGDLVKTLYELGVRDILLDGYGRSAFRHRDDLFVPDEVAVQVQQTIEDVRRMYPDARIIGGVEPYEPMGREGKEAAWAKVSTCSTGRSAIAILPDGSVPVCFFCPLEDPFIIARLGKEVTIRDAWDHPGMAAFCSPDPSTLSEPCRSCPDKDKCLLPGKRCVRDVFVASGDIRGPDPKCPRASYEREVRMR